MPEAPLHQLTYFSRSLIRGPRWFVETGVERMVTSARDGNAYFGVTGSLLFSDGCFAQILEGPPESVDHIYGAIVIDHRHTEVTLLHRAQVTERRFPDWSMQYLAEPESLRDRPGQTGLFERLSGAMREPDRESC